MEASLYIYESTVMREITLQLPHLESLFLNVSQPRKFIIGVIYRPPNSNINDFLRTLQDIIEFVKDKLQLLYNRRLQYQYPCNQ